MTERTEGIRILGRKQEWGRVADMLAAGSEGHSGTLIVQGPPGVGKTRLLLEAELAAEQRGFAVTSFPMPAVGGLPGVGGIASFLAALDCGPTAEAQPRLVVVDNFHDASAEFANTVISLAHFGRTAPLIRLIGLRAHHDSRAVRRLSGEAGRSSRIELGRVSDEVSLELVTDVLGARPDAKLALMVEGAGGNPLLIVELAEGLREEGSVEILGDLAQLVEERIPQRVRDIALHWLDSMSEKARQLVQVAAAVGGSFMIGEVAAMQRETTASMLPALNEAMAAGLLICPGEQAVFQHELVRRSIAEALPAAVRRALCQDVGALRSRRGVQTPLTPELLLTGPMPGAVQEGPAHALAPGTHLLAIDAGAAITPMPPTTPLASLSAGTTPLHPPVPGRLAVPAQPSGPPAVAPQPAPHTTGPGLARRMVPALLLARSVRREPLPMGLAEELRNELIASLAAVPAPAGSAAADPDRADRMARTIVSLFADNEQRVMDRAREALEAHTGDGGAADVVTATVLMSNLEWAAGNLTEGLRWGRRAAESLSPYSPPMWRPYVRLALASKLSDLGQFEEAEGMIHTAREEAEALGDPAHMVAPLITRARLLLQSSRLQEAQDAAQAGLAAAAKSGGGWAVPVGQAVLILVALRRGDLSSAADYVWRCRAVVGADTTVFPSIHFDWGECLVATAQLGPRRTAELLTTRYVHLLTAPQLIVEEAGAAPWFVRLALAAEDIALATTVVTAAERLAAANRQYPTVAVSASHARGLLERDTGALRRASRDHVSPCAGALADEDLGMLFAAEEGKNGALVAGSLRSALHRFEQIGAKADVDRVRAFMDEQGAPAAVPSRSARSGAHLGWEALTETERTIARLVSDGLTNRQVARRVSLSPHTVNYHLRAIFRKLDINSRVEVARYVAYGA